MIIRYGGQAPRVTLTVNRHGEDVRMPGSGWRKSWAVLLVAGLLGGACGGEADRGNRDSGTTPRAVEPTGLVANACPVEGCRVTIVDVGRSNAELALTWETNFLPDVSKNHIHVYWDRFTAEQVSSDAQARGVAQGEWHPTDAYPTYLTQSEASVANRGDSTHICVTAGDRDHAVLDPRLFDCRDVSEQL